MKYFIFLFMAFALLSCSTKKVATVKVILPTDEALALNLISAIKSENYLSLKQNTVIKNKQVFTAYTKAFPAFFEKETMPIDSLMMKFENGMGIKGFTRDAQYVKQLADSDSIRYTYEHSLIKIDTNTIEDEQYRQMAITAIQNGFHPLIPNPKTKINYNDNKFRVVITSPATDLAINVLFNMVVEYKGEWLFAEFDGFNY